ncbi:MAG: hypothetical protein FWG92_05880 [Leptospirales bacterium]|nr:hypothetical protein [Leptospirales bacterium]
MERIKKAVEFIGLELKNAPDTCKLKLIEEASQKFDLDPLQTEFLTNKLLLS